MYFPWLKDSDIFPVYYIHGKRQYQLAVSRIFLWAFAGVLPCPPGKNSYARHFKGKRGKLYIVGEVN